MTETASVSSDLPTASESTPTVIPLAVPLSPQSAASTAAASAPAAPIAVAKVARARSAGAASKESKDNFAKSVDAFRTISEVADELEVPQHVLRFWEGKFVQIKPLKRGGGRRYYRPDDVDLLRGIRRLLHVDGYTIKGVQKVLRDQGARLVMDLGRGAIARIDASEAARLGSDEGEDEAVAAEIAPTPSAAVHISAAGGLSADARAGLARALAALEGARDILAAARRANGGAAKSMIEQD